MYVEELRRVIESFDENDKEIPRMEQEIKLIGDKELKRRFDVMKHKQEIMRSVLSGKFSIDEMKEMLKIMK